MTGTTLVAVGCWNKERMECKGVSVSGSASWRNEDANKGLWAVSRVDLRSWFSRVIVRLAQLIGESCDRNASVGTANKLLQNPV